MTILLLLFLTAVLAAPEYDRVHHVPGYDGHVPFDQFAGYLPVNDGQKKLFYWFVESQSKPSTDPIVLWLNGGPGCSSMDGFIYEHGPFHFEDGPMGQHQRLTLNQYSWNKEANMIYLDSPCGVGLSYSTDPEKDYVTDDRITARDSHSFLVNFFRAFPEYKANDFYVAGESYAGIYVPTLAQQVLEGNSNSSTFINLKGILVGNGVTSDVFDGNALVPFVFGHGLIPDSLHAEIVSSCQGNYWNATGKCQQLLFNDVYPLVQDLNVYNIYENCYGLTEKSNKIPFGNVENVLDSFERVTRKVQETVRGEVPCIDSSRAHAWLNLEEVRQAVHAISVHEKEWTICANINYTSTYNTVIPIHRQLLDAGKRVLIYSGDTDMCVPYTGSEAWTDSLGLPVKEAWRPWKVNHQVAGYTKAYEHGLTFATIKGSGHTVPQYKPAQAAAFFTKFLKGEPF